MPTVLITGANRGIGLEFARQYAAAGWTVHATARNPEKATELSGVASSVHVHSLDISDGAAVAALGQDLAGEAIDILINNAGINSQTETELGEIDYDRWLELLQINALAPLRVAEAFRNSVVGSERRIMAFMTSRAGSISQNIAGGRYLYRSSKAALNAVVRSLAIDLLPEKAICVAIHPGWVRTDMGGGEAPLDAVTSVTAMRQLLERIEPHHAGHFLNYDGVELAW